MLEDDDTGGTLASNDDIIAQYQTTRVRSFWTSYKRIFQLTKVSAITLDPGQFKVTNTFPYDAIAKLSTDDKIDDQFNIEVNKTVYSYKTSHRAQLLCQLFECIAKCVPEKFKTAGPIRAQRLRKNGSRVDCKLAIAPYGVIEIDGNGQVLQEYKWVNISKIGSDEVSRGFFFEATGRVKLFFVEDVDKIINASKFQLKQLGLDQVPYLPKQDFSNMVSIRNASYEAIPAAVTVFDVNKVTRRNLRPVPRQLHISEDYLVEKDASGFQFVSFQRVDSVYAIVRSWFSAREFSIEFNDGSTRAYTSAVRDSLLALLLDVCHAAGNVRVIVTGQVSDGLRLMPRFAEEEYEASLKDTFFGASSIEAWFLSRLVKAARAVPLNTTDVEQACKELNANVPCPGITPNSDLNLVKSALSGVLRSLNSALITCYDNEHRDNSRSICTLLQTLFRIIPSIHGFKCFVEVKEVDTRQLLLQLLKFDHDFVNYWTLEVLMVLCRCPLSPRSIQQEFINKHTLLTDKMLLCLIELMSYRGDDASILLEGLDASAAAAGNLSEAGAGGAIGDAMGEVEDDDDDDDGQEKFDSPHKSSFHRRQNNKGSPPGLAPELAPGLGVQANPSTFAHIPKGSIAGAASKDHDDGGSFKADTMAAASNSLDLVNFTPNSLVVIGAAALLESLVSSRRDTSSPELLAQVLKVMGDRCEVLISMLRSTSFLIMENAAILMFTLIKNRPLAAPLLKELALSECLVLKHFYNAVFSPSGTQRFISRFLVATWISGPAKTNPGKALLLRMIPSGLAEYLKYAPITEEHRRNLDNLEDEFYASFANAAGHSVATSGSSSGINRSNLHTQRSNSNSNSMQARMRQRISAALKEQMSEKNRIPMPAAIASIPLPVSAPVAVAAQTSLPTGSVSSSTTTVVVAKTADGGVGADAPAATAGGGGGGDGGAPSTTAASSAAAVNETSSSPSPSTGAVAPVGSNSNSNSSNSSAALSPKASSSSSTAGSTHNTYENNNNNNNSKANASNHAAAAAVAATTAAIAAAAKLPPENFRIMFHVMTQDHKLPDLIWNEQTRLELRSTVEAEIKEFEREQRLLGSRKIAWNYQQFSVRYESLRDEMQVGPIYVRYFLDAGESFLRQLENPSHIVLFEKLFRRVLVNIESNPVVSILCTKCLKRLYQVCKDIIGGFDDMLIIVRMLEQAADMELQHSLMDLLVQLAAEPSNLLQLLDKTFVRTIIKYASLAHINPDQIGNVLARATTNVLMIKDSVTGETRRASGSNNSDSSSRSSARATAATPSSFTSSDAVGGKEEKQEEEASKTLEMLEEEEAGRRLKRSLWVPDDVACPKVWFVAPRGTNPPPRTVQRGPFRVSELLQELDLGSIDADSLVAPIPSEDFEEERHESIVDTGKWRPISEYFQLRMQMLFPGKAVYSPAEIAIKSLRLLRRLAAVHKSANIKAVPFYPSPMSKRIMSDPEHLRIFAQLLLSNDGGVVESTADLLRSLVEYNLHANSKLYLTGTFFFACRYTGNNFMPLAKLFAKTHLKQSFHDSAASVARDLPIAARSILGSIVPQAMVCLLHNYGADRFASVFTGDYDTPEVIWNAELRKHMVEMIDQHIGDFPARLRQFSLAEYEYVPIPKIHYTTLDKEIYVHEYYLRNLCDEVRFPDWPIGAPLLLLREAIERWRVEMSKGVVDTAVVEARELLELPAKGYDNSELRKAYKTLARKFHPDRNPDGREMFEKIHDAYELLSSIELQVTETDMLNVVLLMKTQNIIYRRFPHKIADQKYPAYALLMSILHPPIATTSAGAPAATIVSGIEADVLIAGTMLMYYSTTVSPLNAAEFVKAGAVTKLCDIITYALQIVHEAEGQAVAKQLLEFALKTLTAVSSMESGREALLQLCPQVADDLYTVLSLDKIVPLAAENSIEVISRCCPLAELQSAFIAAGVVWRLVPFLLAYDSTLRDDYADETQRTVHNQSAANMHAIVATKALGRLGGYMYEDLASPDNETMRRCMNALLTQPLARLLRNRRPWNLLEALNENVEKTTKIWNVGMRTELLDFMLKVDAERAPGSNPEDLQPAISFSFSALRDELCIGGVYVRIFNKTAETNDIDDPSKFCLELVDYLWQRVYTNNNNSQNKDGNGDTNQNMMGRRSHSGDDGESKVVSKVHLDYAVEALRTLAEAQSYVAYDIGNSAHGVEMTFMLLSLPSNTPAFTSAAQLLGILFAAPEFVTCVQRVDQATTTTSTATATTSETSSVPGAEATGRAARTACVWRLLQCLCTVDTPEASVAHAWTAAEALAAHPVGLNVLLNAGAVVHLLGVLVAVQGYAKRFESRLAAISLLSKFLWNPVKGGDASATLRRFIPEPVVVLLRSKAGNASLEVLDTVCEHPELIWTAEMQKELRQTLLDLFNTSSRSTEQMFNSPPVLSADYMVKYRQLASEIYIGGVYIRLYLKQPTFRLSNPVVFVEKLVEFWESAFNIQAPAAAGGVESKGSMSSGSGDGNDSTQGDRESSSRAVVLGNEDFLALLTSCLVCAIKGEPSVVDHLLTWGFVHSIITLLKRALITGRRGTPMTSLVRLLFQLLGRLDVVDNCASCKVDLVAQLTHCLYQTPSVSVDDSGTGESLPRDAALVVELLKKIFQSTLSRYLDQFVRSAMQVNLPNFLLDKILGASPTAFRGVTNPSALKIHTVDLLKAIMAAADEETGAILQALFGAHPSWQEYRHQNHDLFITDKEKTDVYLIQDTIDSKFAGLLTNGEVSAGISDMFSSNSYVPPAPPLAQEMNFASPFVSVDPNPDDNNNAGAGAVSSTSVDSTYGSSASAGVTSAAVTATAGGGASASSSIDTQDIDHNSAPSSSSSSSNNNNFNNNIKVNATNSGGVVAGASSAPALAPSSNRPPPPSRRRSSRSTGNNANDSNSNSSSSSIISIATTVHKGELGIGLDLGKSKSGMGQVLRFKELPPEAVNPAAMCDPPIHVGDVIVEVNGTTCTSLSETVKIIRAAAIGAALQLKLERKEPMSTGTL